MSGDQHDLVLVVDFGAQYAQLIARRVREAHVYSEIVSRSMPIAEMLERNPKAIILSGGPASVHVDGAPSIDPAIYDAGVPLLGICYGAQLVARDLGGEVAKTGAGEYGRTTLRIDRSSLLLGREPGERTVWMSHFDAMTGAPAGFVVAAATDGTPAAVIEDRDRGIYAVQFHPEVAHTERGQEILKAFLYDVAHCRPTWTNVSIIERAVSEIRAQVGGERVICGLSGGVDSAIAAALVHKAVGDQLTCVFVDTGLLRHNEAEQVEDTFRRQFAIDLVHVKAGDRFLDALDDVIDPERKRKIIGELFIRVFEEAAKDVGDAASWCRERCIPTSSSRGAPTTRTSSRTTMWVGSPTTWSSSWSSRCAICSRTKCARSAKSSGCPRRSSGANRSRAPVSRSASSARSHPSASRSSSRPMRWWSRRSSARACTARSGRASPCCPR